MIQIYERNKMTEQEKMFILQRAQADITNVKENVAKIIQNVREHGDAALLKYTKMWDDKTFDCKKLRVTKEEIRQAYENIVPEVRKQMRAQIRLAKKFHEAQHAKIKNWEKETAPGIRIGEKWTPIDATRSESY